MPITKISSCWFMMPRSKSRVNSATRPEYGNEISSTLKRILWPIFCSLPMKSQNCPSMSVNSSSPSVTFAGFRLVRLNIAEVFEHVLGCPSCLHLYRLVRATDFVRVHFCADVCSHDRGRCYTYEWSRMIRIKPSLMVAAWSPICWESNESAYNARRP